MNGFLIILALLFLLGTFLLTTLNSVIRGLTREQARDVLKKRFFYSSIHRFFFSNHVYEGTLFASTLTQTFTRFFYASTALLLIIPLQNRFILLFSALLWFLIGFFVGEYLPRLIGNRFKKQALQFCEFGASCFLTLTFPLTFCLIKLSNLLFRSAYLDSFHEPTTQIKREIIDMVHEAQVGPTFETHDKKLIESVLKFKEKMAREIMIPRVNLFSLPQDTPIKEAAKLLEQEGYSRVPVFKETVDQITGILMYKDILTQYMKFADEGNPEILTAPIETIQKSALYAPETKKISHLLQDFRKEQVHMAIVVDEYGGTEGIVTIEDILEEIVGEIEDEYDELEEIFTPQTDGSWIVDARMNLHDVKARLNIEIPQEGDYDTIGGFIFHRIGSIPQKGVVIHHDEFELKILSSSDRSVKMVRLKPMRKEIQENEGS